jgi:hypothetical protein
MNDIQFVNPTQMKTLEQYGAALLSGVYSLKTLEAFHIQAFSIGLLDSDEEEAGKTICWEIQRLIGLYKTQMQNVLDRTAIDETQIIESLKLMMPNVKIPNKKAVKKKKNDG